jgi:hypothetical protein
MRGVTIDPRIKRERLVVLEALVLALDRQSEVSDTVSTRRRIRQLLSRSCATSWAFRRWRRSRS